MKLKRILALCLILLLALPLVSCQNPLGERDYMEDLYIEIPNSQNKLLIQEWQYLLGSGAEVYWVSPDEKSPVLLGMLSGGDDGYCPFRDGRYKVTFEENTVTIFWAFTGSDTTCSRSEKFTLPK